MCLLSKSEIQFLQGQKLVSKSYEYKLKSIIKKKVSNLFDKEIPLLSSLFPTNHDLTKFSKMFDEYKQTNLTKISKAPKPTKPDVKPNGIIGNLQPECSDRRNKKGFYNIHKIHRLKLRWCRSANNNSCTVRSSISPFQGDDPGFKSRPEHRHIRIIQN